MRFRFVLAAATFAAALAATPAFAQRQGGGFGGFGGGRGGGGLLGLLRMEEVQKEIELLDDQKEQVNKLAEEARAAFTQGQQGDRESFQNLSEEERQKRFAEFREQAEKRAAEQKTKLADILLPNQMERLEQLNIQQQGTRALTDKEVVAKLKLSEDQQKKIETVYTDAFQKLRDQGQQGGGFERFQAMQKQIETDVLAVLTEDQKKQFDELKGKPFTFPQRQFGGGQGRRPGGNQRPNPDA